MADESRSVDVSGSLLHPYVELEEPDDHGK